MGRLSNPPDPLESLAGQGIADSSETRENAAKRVEHAPNPSASGGREEEGQLSHPSTASTEVLTAMQASATTDHPRRHQVQKRLRGTEVDDLVAAYRAGASLDDLADRFGVHRTTAVAHLRRRHVEPRDGFTAWDPAALTAAAALYASGASLAAVATRFGVDPSTVANRFRRVGIAVRPRRGWPQEAEPTAD
jgi:lambda repressor-like predicted transcriptional regulator